MKFSESIETCLVRQYADFVGFATRSEFWWFILFIFIAQASLSIVSQALASVFALVTLIPYFAAGTRRLRDTRRSPWWWAVSLIPVIGVIILIIFWTQQGDTPTTPT
jgi:uncharacterized membrane protein YhaH (DUF805 family)